MGHVTFVHGIGNKPREEDLRRLWGRALADGDAPLPLGDLGVTTRMTVPDGAKTERKLGGALSAASVMSSLLSGHMAAVGRLPALTKDSSIEAPAMQTLALQ